MLVSIYFAKDSRLLAFEQQKFSYALAQGNQVNFKRKDSRDVFAYFLLLKMAQCYCFISKNMIDPFLNVKKVQHNNRNPRNLPCSISLILVVFLGSIIAVSNHP